MPEIIFAIIKIQLTGVIPALVSVTALIILTKMPVWLTGVWEQAVPGYLHKFQEWVGV